MRNIVYLAIILLGITFEAKCKRVMVHGGVYEVIALQKNSRFACGKGKKLTETKVKGVSVFYCGGKSSYKNFETITTLDKKPSDNVLFILEESDYFMCKDSKAVKSNPVSKDQPTWKCMDSSQ